MINASNYLAEASSVEFWLITIAALIVLAIKGFALWEAAKRNEKWWFIALLFINTLGILEIVYIFVFAKDKKEEKVLLLNGAKKKK